MKRETLPVKWTALKDRPDLILCVADQLAPTEVAVSLAQMLGRGARVNAFRRRMIAPAARGKFALLKPLASRSSRAVRYWSDSVCQTVLVYFPDPDLLDSSFLAPS